MRPVALVTGASRGIGRATAVALADAGYDVAIGARTLKEGTGRDDSPAGGGRAIAGSLESTAADVEAAGGAALCVAMDILDRASLEAAVDAVLANWGRIDVLVNNAVDTGPGSMEPFAELTVEDLERKLSANAVAPFALAKLVVPHLLAQGGGTIVNITSAVAISDPAAPTGKGGWGMAYAMSKGAMHRMAGILAVELADGGVRAFNVEPGFVVTERMLANQRELGLEGVYPGAPPTVPASVVRWLCTDPEAETLNGQTITAQRFARERGLHPDWRGR
jgi:NAD(P)-dependent dehydrogenase (short-subunit alcohol dehydrogenase family)